MVSRLKQVKDFLYYQPLLNRITDAAWLMDMQGQICLTNKSWQNQLWQFPLAAIPLFENIVQPKDRLRIRELWQACSEQQRWQERLNIKSIQGNYQPFNLDVEKFVDDNCDRQLYLGTATIVREETELLTHHRNLSSSQPKPTFGEWSQAAAWQWNLVTQQLCWTPEFAILLNYLAEDNYCSVSQWLDHIYQEDQKQILATLEAAIKIHSAEYSCEYRIQDEEDKIRWIDSRGKIYYDAQGQVELISGLAYDVTDYKQKENTLRHNIAFAERILEGNQDCIKLLDLNGRLLYMNDGGQKLMEIDNFEETVKNAPWLSFWSGSDRQAALEAFSQACDGQASKFDGYCTTAKGTPKWWEVAVTPIMNEDNQVEKILSVSRNITARKLLEQKLTKQNQELDAFSYLVSHDLKAPLRGITNLVEWIIEDEQELSSETKQRLVLMNQRVTRMDALIDGLLQYSRVGKQKLATESVNIADLLIEVTDSIAPPEGFKILNVTDLPTLSTKKLLLSQVLTNLLSNAIKHHDQDSGNIEISAIDRHSHYELAIADDGPGIPEADRESIFQIFYTKQSKTSTTNAGIGLAIVKKIVTEGGGKIWLDSQTYQGSKFCFTWSKTSGE